MKPSLPLSLTLLCAAAAPLHAGDAPPQPELARLIERLTSRAVAPWQISKSADGTTRIDTGEGFQHVALAQAFGQDLRLGCVASLGEAKRFFGRDIASGKALPGTVGDPALQAIAERHGMAPQEYVFYRDMIEHWKAGGAKAGATITIVNNDAPDEGFNSTAAQLLPAPGNNNKPNLGAQRLALFEAAADVWAAFLDSEIEIRVDAQFNPLSPCTPSGGVLGGAGANGLFADNSGTPPNPEFLATVYPNALFSKQRGVDANGASPEINTTFNSDVDAGCLGVGTRFYYGLDNATPNGTINLFAVVLHELGHGLGFASFANPDGSRPGDIPDIWARYQIDASTGETWDTMTNAEREDSSVDTGDLFWIGSNVSGASGDLSDGRDPAQGWVQLYAPSAYAEGSSVSHFDTEVSPNVLMEPFISTGLPLDLDLTRQLMRDIGWFRDSNLDGVADTISNVQPSGGSLEPGTNISISWSQTSGFDRNVTIELSTDGGATFPTVIAQNVANTGSRSWTVPNIATNQARIRVREHDFVAPAGVSAANFSIAANAPPSFTPAAAISRQRGSTAGSPIAVGTVSDPDTAVGTLTVTQIAGGSSSGVSAAAISNNAGAVTAAVSASCNASAGTLRFQVSDGSSTGSGNLQVNLSNNSAPLLGYADASVDGGGARSISPNLGPSDNGTISAFSVANLGTFAGLVSVDAGGVVSVSNAAPVGQHTLVIRATDNCSSSTEASFVLTVNNTAPSFTPAAAITRQQGSPAGAAVTVGTVSDAQTFAGSLEVSAVTGGTASGLLVSDPINTLGTVSASVAAGCSATTGTQRFQVSDGALSSTGDLQVTVTANTPPQLAYPNLSLAFDATGTLGPTTPPTDNGSVESISVLSTGSFTGTLGVGPGGVVSIGNAAPPGVHTIALRAVDNCGAPTDASFQLQVREPSLFEDGFEDP